MKKENDEMRELFRSRLSTAGMPVREDFWEKLQEELPPAVQTQAPRIFSLFRYSAAAAILVLIVAAYALVTYLSPNREIEEAFRELAVTREHTALPTPALSEEKITEQTPQPEKQLPSYTASSVRTVPASLLTTQEEEVDSISLSFSFSITVTSEEEHGSGSSPYTATSYEKTPDDYYRSLEPMLCTGSRIPTWTIAPYISTAFRSTENPSGLRSLASKDVSSVRTSTVKHRMPVTAGVAISRPLNRKVALESGIFYTFLQSELHANEYIQEQKLHYIGLPLKAAVTLFEKKGFDLYLSAGGAIEKCISGTLRTNHSSTESTSRQEKESVRPDGLQYSLNAAAGVQYKLNERLALYAEPGLTYHFDDNTSVSTLRKERPLNFNLSCGVKIIY